jgi:hypothetical protein
MKRTLIAVAVAVVSAAAILLVPLPFEDTTRVPNTIDIGQPPARVFDYVTTPGNWPHWHPSSQAVHGAIDHPLQTGEQVIEDFSVAGRQGQVIWTVVEHARPSHWKIAGRIDGRPAGTVQYDLAPIPGDPARDAQGEPATRFTREFDYGAPNLLFSILNRVALRARIERESTAAVQALKRELERPPQLPHPPEKA